MAMYKPIKSQKSLSQFTSEENAVLEVELDLVPDVNSYVAGRSYKCVGLGGVFDGVYKFNKVTHTINSSGYTCTADGERVGVQINVPKPSPKPATAPVKVQKEITHKVVKGDSLWKILKKYGKNPLKYPQVAKYNNIKNPDLIYPGQIIKIPANI